MKSQTEATGKLNSEVIAINSACNAGGKLLIKVASSFSRVLGEVAAKIA